MKSHSLFSHFSSSSSSSSSSVSTEDLSASSHTESRIVIVCLNMNKNDYNYHEFCVLDAVDKIKKLSIRINALCEQLTKSEPQALWIMTWRENGIAETGLSYISSLTKSYLKEELIKLTKQYNQLAIVGALSSVKMIKDVGCYKKLIQLEAYYQRYQTFIDSNADDEVLSKQWHNHLKQVTSLKKNKTTTLQVMRNTAYIFQAGHVQKHDKKLPFDETFRSICGFVYKSLGRDFVFQPAKEKNAKHCFELIHPLTQRKISLGIEICFEHYIGLLKRGMRNKVVDIHLVLSDSVNAEPLNIAGDFFIHVDSTMSSSVFKPPLSSKKSIEVILYKNSLLNEDTELGVNRFHV